MFVLTIKVNGVQNKTTLAPTDLNLFLQGFTGLEEC